MIKGSKVIATGKNGYRGRFMSKSQQTTHAEISAIRILKHFKKRKINKLAIVSIAYDGFNFRYSKPCKNCCLSLIECGIKYIYWYDEFYWFKSNIVDLLDSTKLSSGDRFVFKTSNTIN